jgi:hypothetical protein
MYCMVARPDLGEGGEDHRSLTDLVVHWAAAEERLAALPPSRGREQHVFRDARLRVSPEEVAAKVVDELARARLVHRRESEAPSLVMQGFARVAHKGRLAHRENEQLPRHQALEGEADCGDIVGDEENEPPEAHPPTRLPHSHSQYAKKKEKCA